jgi:3-phenylpropionate/trans-cinnamate dioxygenase ferredoxin subunit
MSKIRIMDINDIENENMTQVSIKDKQYLVAKINDILYVTSDMCTHEDAELTMGCLKGTTVKCPLHGSFFDLTTGLALNEPADEPIKVYKTIIENDQLYIDE